MTAVPTLLALLVLCGFSPADLPVDGGWREQTLAPADSQEYRLFIPWLIEETLLITCQGNLLAPGADWRWEDSTRTLVIPPRVCPDSLRIRWRVAEVLPQTTFRYYTDSKPLAFSKTSSQGRYNDTLRRDASNLRKGWDRMRRSGMLSRGIKFGDEGGGVTSGMRLELSGDPAPDVRVDALLDDRGMPLGAGGSSATLGELERVLARVSTPHLAAELGDWDANWRNGRYGDLDRQLKGGWLGVKRDRLAGEVAAGGSDLTYRNVVLTGRSGDQGPYELTDRNGLPGVTVAVGSERVRLNGESLVRGRQGDYTLDYSRGEITFTPRVIVRDDSRLEVEYQYLDGEYPRYFYGGQGWLNPDSDYLREALLTRWKSNAKQRPPSVFTVQASALSEGQDGERPQSWEWREEWREAMAAAGDDERLALVSGVDSVGAGLGDYVWQLSGADSILVFSPPDSVGKPTGNLTVRFERDAAGSYSQRYDGVLRAVYYEWVGVGLGYWSPTQALLLPERLNHADLRLGIKAGRWSFNAETAASDFDRNTLSSRDDGDNVGAAWQGRAVWEAGADSLFRFEVTGENRETAYHSPQRSVEPDYGYRWNLGATDPNGVKSVNTTASLSPLPRLRLDAEGGWLRTSTGAESRRGGANLAYQWRSLKGWGEFQHTLADRISTGRALRSVWAGGMSVQRKSWEPFYSFRSEVNRLDGGGEDHGGASATHESGLNLRWQERQSARLIYNHRENDRFLSDGDQPWSTARAVSAAWTGAGYRWGGWNASAQRNWTTFTSPEQASPRSTSAQIAGRFSPVDSPWSFDWDYGLTAGGSRRRETVAVYVGEGEGGYRREGDRYVPDPDGDFDLQEAVIDTLDRQTTVDFSGEARWRVPRSKPGAVNNRFAGITSHRLRWTASNSSVGEDPWRVFLLLPESFATADSRRSRILLEDETGFHEGSPGGDETLRLRREDSREAASGYGYSTRLESVTFRLRRNLGEDWNLRFEPQAERERRWGLGGAGLLNSVENLGGELETGWAGKSDWAGSAALGYTERFDRVLINSAQELKIAPRFARRIRSDASVTVEGEWLRLKTERPTSGYDLLRGNDVGDNYRLTFNAEYRLHEHLTATAYYTGRWRGLRSPRHEAQIELTATF